MKKKVLSIALVVALIAIMVSGTLAYFTAEDEVTNTFTVGSVKIEIYENGNATTEDVRELGVLTPVVNMDNPSADDSYLEKVVKVRNTGLNNAYVRTHIAIPTALVNYLDMDLDTTGWTVRTASTATVDGVAYTVYTFDYNNAITSGEYTSELLKGVFLNSNVDLEEASNGDLYFVLRENGKITDQSGVLVHEKNDDGTYTSHKVCVLVASQAIQADGFANAASALDAGFTTNPWA